MPNIGFPELLVIAMILVLVFGASRLPQLGAGMGRAVRKLKRSLDQDERIEVSRVSPDTSAAAPQERKTETTRSGTTPEDQPADAEIIEETPASRRD